MKSKRSKWEEELHERATSLRPATAGDDEFDAVFGENIAKTMSGYMLMVLTLSDIKRSLLMAIRVFFGISALFFVAILSVVVLAWQGSYAKENNDKLKNNEQLAEYTACVAAAALERPPPPDVDCPRILQR